MKKDKKQMSANVSNIKTLVDKALEDISRPLKICKKGKGYYMRTMNKAKASKIMQARANDRWNKATASDRRALGLMLAQARKAKKAL